MSINIAEQRRVDMRGCAYRELPTEDVDEEDNSLGFRAGLGLGNVCLDAANGFDTAGGVAGVDVARNTAGGNTDAGRHVWYGDV